MTSSEAVSVPRLTLSVYEIVGSPLCVASDDGQKVYDRLAVALKEGRAVTLSFHNVTALTSAFLNAAIGQAYGEFSEDEIRGLVKVADLQDDDLGLLRRVVETAKRYFNDPYFLDAVHEVMEADSDAE